MPKPKREGRDLPDLTEEEVERLEEEIRVFKEKEESGELARRREKLGVRKTRVELEISEWEQIEGVVSGSGSSAGTGGKKKKKSTSQH